MKLIVGLGNVGKEYENTRHNAGFLAVGWLAEQWEGKTASWHKNPKLGVSVLKSPVIDVLLARPLTMMNESGKAVRALMDYYKIAIGDLIIIHDDADLELGDIKTVDSTSTGAGHHGVLSVINHVGPGFKRVRVGIGRPDQPVRDIGDYVLGRLSSQEQKMLQAQFQRYLENSIAD